ncbi:MAG: hypothetical protein IKL53_08700, partial [Lachnospiraceae bacterium]|nr:hypothetical protein [Lachnospiraceae bacterium]
RDYIERSNEYDIDAILYSSINTTENDSESESSTTENDDDTDEEYISVESSDIKYTDYMEKLTIEVKNMINNKQPISSIKRKIDDICKEDIFNLFINEETLPSKINMTEYDVLKYDWALKYIYSAPNQTKYRDFMWSVIPWCHMERNIFITNNPQEKNSNA